MVQIVLLPTGIRVANIDYPNNYLAFGIDKTNIIEIFDGGKKVVSSPYTEFLNDLDEPYLTPQDVIRDLERSYIEGGAMSGIAGGDLSGFYPNPTVPGLTTKQPLNSNLTQISATNPDTPGVVATDGGGWFSKTYAALKSALGLSKGDVGLSNVENVDTTTTSNISDSTDKRFVTDINLSVLSNTSNTNSGDETQSSIISKLSLHSGSVNIDFGISGDILINTVLAAWVTPDHYGKIKCEVLNDGVEHSGEEVYLENILANVYNIQDGVSFDIITVAHNSTSGKYVVKYNEII